MPFHIAAETIGGIPWKQPTKEPGTQHDVKKKPKGQKKNTSWNQKPNKPALLNPGCVYGRDYQWIGKLEEASYSLLEPIETVVRALQRCKMFIGNGKYQFEQNASKFWYAGYQQHTQSTLACVEQISHFVNQTMV